MEEQEASYYLRQFVHAIAYCHKHRVVHRCAAAACRKPAAAGDVMLVCFGQ
jgi:hypothetical protein